MCFEFGVWGLVLGVGGLEIRVDSPEVPPPPARPQERARFSQHF